MFDQFIVTPSKVTGRIINTAGEVCKGLTTHLVGNLCRRTDAPTGHFDEFIIERLINIWMYFQLEKHMLHKETIRLQSWRQRKATFERV